MTELIFIHGLNTYGDHDIHIGPLKFGPMHIRLERAFSDRGIRFRSISGSMFAHPFEQAEQIVQQVQSLPITTRFHVLGQSTGGLVARAVAQHPKLHDRVASVLTMGTPHRGAPAAEFGLAFNENHPLLKRVLATCGYDTARKLTIFQAYTPKAVDEFCQELSARAKTPASQLQASFICQVEGAQTSWPLLMLESLLNSENQMGDGLISSDSQRFGLVQGPFALDHFGELGFFPHFSRSARVNAALEFNRMIDAIVSTVYNEGRLNHAKIDVIC